MPIANLLETPRPRARFQLDRLEEHNPLDNTGDCEESANEGIGVTDSLSDSELVNASDAKTSRRSWTRAGVVLIVTSALLWVALPVVPFLPLDTGAKTAAAGALLVAAEIAFWLGALLAGPEAVKRMRAWTRTAIGRRS